MESQKCFDPSAHDDAIKCEERKLESADTEHATPFFVCVCSKPQTLNSTYIYFSLSLALFLCLCFEMWKYYSITYGIGREALFLIPSEKRRFLKLFTIYERF